RAASGAGPELSSMLVLVRGKQPAIDAVGARRVVEHEVAHPVALAARCGALEGLVLQIVCHHLHCALVLEDLGGSSRLDGAAGMYGDGRGRAALDPLRERIGELALIVLAQERAEVLRELGAPGSRGMQSRASRLSRGGQFHTVGREAVADQLGPHAFRVPVLAEYRE